MNTANQIETMTLIEGVFTEQEASDILLGILTAKIKFHQLRNFSSQERYGCDDATAQKRIPELQRTMSQIKSILAEARTAGKQLRIQSEIHIELTDV